MEEKYIVEDMDGHTKQFKLPLDDLIDKMLSKTGKEISVVYIYDAKHRELGTANCGFWYPA